jgi:hypothetical protein
MAASSSAGSTPALALLRKLDVCHFTYKFSGPVLTPACQLRVELAHLGQEDGGRLVIVQLLLRFLRPALCCCGLLRNLVARPTP